MKCYSATITLADGKELRVNYPADHPVPNQAALEAAAKVLGKQVNPTPLSIRHHRDGEPVEAAEGEPSSPRTT